MLELPWRRKPRLNEARVNWRNPITKDLTGAWIFNDKYTRDFAQIRNGFPINGPTFHADARYHTYWRTNGSDNFLSFGDYSTGEDGTYAYFFIMRTDEADASRWYIAQASNSSANPITGALSLFSGKLRAYIRNDAGTVLAQTDTSIAINDNVWRTYAITYDASTLKLYRDGVLDSQLSGAFSGTLSLNTLGIGTLIRSSISGYASCDMALAYLYDRTLSAEEIASLHWNPYQLFEPMRLVLAVPVGAEIFEQALAGSLSYAGLISRQTGKNTAGALASSGALLKQTGKPLSGALTSSGVVATVKEVFKLLSGVLSSSGSLTRRTGKKLSGALTSAGAAVKQSEITLSGTLTGVGDLTAVRAVFKLLTGALSPAGTLTRRTSIGKSGDLTPAGDVTRQTRKSFAGVLTSSGALQTVKGLIVMLSGALDFSGDVVKQTAVTASGTLTTAGSLVKQSGVGLSGVLTSSGDLEAVRTILKLLTGILTSSGAIAKLPQKHLAGTIPATGRLTRSTAKAFSGALTSSGRVIKRSLLRLGGSLAFTGILDAIGTLLRILGLSLRHRTVHLTLRKRTNNLTLRNRK